MTPTATTLSAAFRDLERALLRRRFLQLDLRLRLELAAIALLVGGFCAWQARVLWLAGLAYTGGPEAVVRALAAGALALAAVGGVVSGVLYARRLGALARGGVDAPGPAWLSLPIPPPLLARHLAWEARLGATWTAVPALGGLAGALGLVPLPLLALMGAAYAGLLLAAGHAGCALAFRLATRAPEREPAWPGLAAARIHPLERALASVPASARAGLLPAARWRRARVWRALWLKDLLVTRRPTPAQHRARTTLVCMVLAALSWRLPVDPRLARLAAFALSLLAAAMLAEWLIDLAGADPFPALRTLPVGALPAWTSRAVWAAGGALLLAGLHALALPALAPEALRVFLVWTSGATLAIGMLGVHYGLTLYPRADHAERMLGLTLALAIAASLMIPLVGWILLLTALIHSARRLPRWSRIEEA